MKNIHCCAALCVLFVLESPTISLACGSKFLVKNGTVKKSQCYVTGKPGAILMYLDPNVKATENALGKDMQRKLSNVGHNVRVVESRQEFESAIRNEVFDVILSGYSACQDAENTLRDAGKKAKFVPVVDKENEVELKAARERYGNIINDGDKTSTKVLTVGEVLLEAGTK
jgi:hypothetical protein